MGASHKDLHDASKELEAATPEPMNRMLDRQEKDVAVTKWKERQGLKVVNVEATAGILYMLGCSIILNHELGVTVGNLSRYFHEATLAH